MTDAEKLRWKSHFPSLIKETLENNSCGGILVKPWEITLDILYSVAQRASVINDPELNLLMCDLALYEISDPFSKGYDPEKVKAVEEQVIKIQAQRAKE